MALDPGLRAGVTMICKQAFNKFNELPAYLSAYGAYALFGKVMKKGFPVGEKPESC